MSRAHLNNYGKCTVTSEEVRNQIAHVIGRIYRHGMTTSSGGNLSARDDEGNVWVTPARLDKANLRPQDTVCVTPDGDVEGPHPPTSELPFHLAIYRARPDIKAVIHAHPSALVAYSAAKRVPENRILHQTFNICGKIGLAPYAPPGSESLGESIAAQFSDESDCVVMENHGIVVGGTSLNAAFKKFETLETTAQILLKAALLGEPCLLNEQQLALPNQVGAVVWEELPSGTPSEKELRLRREVCEFIRRGYTHRLITSTSGTFSARVDKDSFLITPHDIDRNSIEVNDLVLIERGSCEYGKKPSRAVISHRAIYNRHADIDCIVNATPINATAHSVTGKSIRTDIIPESYVVLRDIQRCSYGLPFSNPEGLAELISMRQPVVMIENDGVLVAGTCVVDVFDRLEVLESSAEAMLVSQVFGTLELMSEDILAQLREAIPEAYGAIRNPTNLP